MISKEHSSNNNKFEIELPKHPHSMVIIILNTGKKNLWRVKLSGSSHR